MKFLSTITFLLIYSISQSQSLSDSSIHVNHIRQVTIQTSTKSKNGYRTIGMFQKTVTVYNKNGKPNKSIHVLYSTDNKTRDSSIIEYLYQDTLVIRAVWKEYKNGRLTEKGVEKYNYDFTFDSLNRKISQLTIDGSGRQTKEEYVWGSSNKMDEIHYYSNDSSVYIPQRRGYDQVLGKALHLNKVVKNYWNDYNDRLIKSIECTPRCRYSYFKNLSDSLCCRTIEYLINRDTLIQKETYYNEGWQTTFEKEYTMPYGPIYRESSRGDQSFLFQRKNNKGLLLKQEDYSLQIEGYFLESTTTYEYKYY